MAMIGGCLASDWQSIVPGFDSTQRGCNFKRSALYGRWGFWGKFNRVCGTFEEKLCPPSFPASLCMCTSPPPNRDKTREIRSIHRGRALPVSPNKAKDFVSLNRPFWVPKNAEFYSDPSSNFRKNPPIKSYFDKTSKNIVFYYTFLLMHFFSILSTRIWNQHKILRFLVSILTYLNQKSFLL